MWALLLCYSVSFELLYVMCCGLEQVLAEEFSHTVIHRKPLGVLGQRGALPKASKPVPGKYKLKVNSLLQNCVLSTNSDQCQVSLCNIDG